LLPQRAARLVAAPLGAVACESARAFEHPHQTIPFLGAAHEPAALARKLARAAARRLAARDLGVACLAQFGAGAGGAHGIKTRAIFPAALDLGAIAALPSRSAGRFGAGLPTTHRAAEGGGAALLDELVPGAVGRADLELSALRTAMLVSGARGRQTPELCSIAQRGARALIHDHPAITRCVATLQQNAATAGRAGLTADHARAATRNVVLAACVGAPGAHLHRESLYRLAGRSDLDVSDQVDATWSEQADEQRT
jgi:hypothetical protein